MNESPLAHQLRQQPAATSEEHVLAEAVGLSDGHPVPFHMFAKVAVATHQHAGLFGALKNAAGSVRKHAIAGLVFLVGNAAAVGGHWLSVHDARIAGEARAEASERAFSEYRASVAKDFDRLENEVSQLRAAMLRMGALILPPSRPGPPSGDSFKLPDKLSLHIARKAPDLCSLVPPSL